MKTNTPAMEYRRTLNLIHVMRMFGYKTMKTTMKHALKEVNDK